MERGIKKFGEGRMGMGPFPTGETESNFSGLPNTAGDPSLISGTQKNTPGILRTGFAASAAHTLPVSPASSEGEGEKKKDTGGPVIPGSGDPRIGQVSDELPATIPHQPVSAAINDKADDEVNSEQEAARARLAGKFPGYSEAELQALETVKQALQTALETKNNEPLFTLLDKPGMSFLENFDHRIDNETPLTRLRTFLDEEKKRQEKAQSVQAAMRSVTPDIQPSPAGSGQKKEGKQPAADTPREKKAGHMKTRKQDFFDTHKKEAGFHVLKDSQEVETLSPATTAVHISRQPLCTLPTLTALADSLPNLRVIQFTPNLRRLVSDKTIAKFAEKGIEIRFGRMTENDYYDTAVFDPEGRYEEKRTSYEQLGQDQKKAGTFRKMAEYDWDEAAIAQLYYSGTDRSSIRKIADELGLTHHRVHKVLQTFDHWMGYPSSSAFIQKRAGSLEERLARVEKSITDRNAWEQNRTEHAVSGKLPPETLHPSRWDTWQKIYERYGSDPQAFADLAASHPREFVSMAYYYQLGGLEGQDVPMEEVGASWGLSKERVRQLRNEALSLLDILK